MGFSIHHSTACSGGRVFSSVGAGGGQTHQEALAAVEHVAHEWIETARHLVRAIPEPKGTLTDD